MVAGVSGGLAAHLGLQVRTVRIAFVLLSFVNFVGVAAYVCLWALVPQAGEFDAPRSDLAAAGHPGDRSRRFAPFFAVGAVLLGIPLLAAQFGWSSVGGFAVPVVVIGLGVAVLWRVADDAQRDRWRAAAASTASGSGRRARLRVLGGVVLVAVGTAAILAVNGGVSAALNGLAALFVVAIGVVAIAGPWLLRLLQEVRDERFERIRSQERAEFAAHVHDSVLQTLTLVQKHADDPREVVRLARAEERSLRGWLYDPARVTAGTFGPSLERAAAEVEGRYGRTGGIIDVVVVGDCDVDDGVNALLQAAREAMVNAAKYAAERAPVSVYAEVGDVDVSVFVRDRGPGFDVDAVPDDRHGLRESIVGRMERHGGRAKVRSSDAGTEVELVMPRETP